MKNISSRLILGLGIGLWSLLALHIFFVYSQSLATKQNVKGGTFLQANVGTINYLPYISDRKEDRYIQNFLFDGCSNPYVSGTDILYSDKLCKITTTDNKNFNVFVNTGKWSDGKNINIEDVFFTYNNIIKSNSLGLAGDEFSQLQITKNGTGLKITFPNNSYDNRIFFTNKILPAHILSGKNLEFYKDNFGKNIVTSSCAKIKQSGDINSFIIDLSKCENYKINNYQLKIFKDFDSLKKYETANKNIDLYFGDEKIQNFTEKKLLLNKFVGIFYNTKNIGPELRQSFTKVGLSGFFDEASANEFVKDQFIFNGIRDDYRNLTGLVNNYLSRKKITTIQKSSSSSSKSSSSISSGSGSNSSQTGNDVKLPSTGQAYNNFFHGVDAQSYITFGNQGGTVSDFSKDYFVPKIDGQFTLSAILPKRYEYVVVAYNGGKGYSPKSFDGRKFNYNISSTYGNYKNGLSKYIITAYNVDGSYDTYIAKIYFSSPPENVITSSSSSLISSSIVSSGNSSFSSSISGSNILTGNSSSFTGNILSGASSTGSINISSGNISSKNFSSSKISSSINSSISTTPKIVVLYLNEGVDKYVGNRLRNRMANLGLLEKFDFRSYDNALDLQEAIASNDYDIVVRSINLGQKRDISPLITSSDPNINISQYNNGFLASAIQQYFLATNQNVKNSQKEIINDIYGKDIPFVLLGKTFEKFYIKQDGNLNQNFIQAYGTADIVKIYDLALLNKNIQDTYIIQKPVYDYSKIWNWKNFQKFIDNATK